MKYYSIFVLVLILLAGCSTTKDTMTGIVEELQGQLDAKEMAIDQLKNQTTVDQEELARLQREKEFYAQQLANIPQNNTDIVEITDQTVKILNEILEKDIEAGIIEIKSYGEVIAISVKNGILFNPDSAVLKPENNSILLRISQVFDSIPDRIIRVEGHTASGRNISFPTSWELGSSRAVSVVRFFQEQAGVDPYRMVAVSFGEYRPIFPNNTETNKVKNRRIEIILLPRPLYQWQQISIE